MTLGELRSVSDFVSDLGILNAKPQWKARAKKINPRVVALRRDPLRTESPGRQMNLRPEVPPPPPASPIGSFITRANDVLMHEISTSPSDKIVLKCQQFFETETAIVIKGLGSDFRIVIPKPCTRVQASPEILGTILEVSCLVHITDSCILARTCTPVSYPAHKAIRNPDLHCERP